MNKARRSQLEQAFQLLEQAKEIIEACKDEEQECFDNLSENLQAAERGQNMEYTISDLEDCVIEIDNIVGSIQTCIER